MDKTMRRRLKILAVVIMLLFFGTTCFIGGFISSGNQFTELVSTQQAELNRIHLAERGLDENGVKNNRLSSLYVMGSPSNSDYSMFENDAEFRDYCKENYPNAVYPTEEWTAEEVIQSYQDNPEIWTVWTDDYSMIAYCFTWTPSYSHCFYARACYQDVYDAKKEGIEGAEVRPGWMPGWFYVDGVRVQLYDYPVVDSIEPRELARAYQKGTWDGWSVMSADLSTEVHINSDGELDYTYRSYQYTRAKDPESLAYTSFAKEPWWKATDLDSEIKTMLTDEEYWPFEDAEDELAYGEVVVKLYPDLPASYDTSEIFSSQWSEEGTFCLSPTGVVLAKAGEVLAEWIVELDEEQTELLRRPEDLGTEYANDVAYLYTGDQLLALRQDGSVVTVLEGIFESNTNSSPYHLWGFREGQLVYFEAARRYSVSESPISLGEVLEVDFETLRLVMKEDGCYAVARDYKRDPEYYLVYLGSETFEYYKEQYATLDSAEIFRW